MTIAQLVDFYGSRGFGCIAVTDHICERRTLLGLAARYMNYTLTPATWVEYLRELDREARRAWREYKMLVLPGFELSKNTLSDHRSAHILGIGLREFITPEADAAELAQAIRAAGGLSVAAHPVQTGKIELQTLHLWNRREELSAHFDAWEVASGLEIFRPVLESGLPMIATSDLHHAANINAWKTVLECELDADAIKDAIRTQRVHFHLYRDTGRPALQPAVLSPLTGLRLAPASLPEVRAGSDT